MFDTEEGLIFGPIMTFPEDKLLAVKLADVTCCWQ